MPSFVLLGGWSGAGEGTELEILLATAITMRATLCSSCPHSHPRVSASTREAMGMYRQRHEEAFSAAQSWISSNSLQSRNLGPPTKGVPQGPLPPGLAPRPDFSLPGSNFSARGSVDFRTREVTVASCSVCASNAKQEQLVAHNNMHCVSEQHNKQFARQPGDIRTILYNREERKEGKKHVMTKP